MTTETPLARYSAVNGALTSGFVTAQLHHPMGHDRIDKDSCDFLAVKTCSRDQLAILFRNECHSCLNALQDLFLRVELLKECDRAWRVDAAVAGLDSPENQAT
jgi:hypothetical protein